MLITLKEGGLKRKQFPKNDFFSTQNVSYNVPRNFFADAAISERIARGKDGKTYMMPSNMKYKDWERAYFKKEISLEQWQEELKNSKIELKTWEQAGKLRTKAEFEELGRKDKTLVEEYTGIPSKWSGNIRANKELKCRKEWNCDISLHEYAP